MTWWVDLLFPWIARGRKEAAEWSAMLRRITLEDAREQALRHLADPRRFTVRKEAYVPPASLHPTARDLFATATLIQCVRGELVFDKDLVEPSADLPGWTRVGTDIEHAELLVSDATGEVLEYDGYNGLKGLEYTGLYPSVFHVIVSNEQILGDP